MKGKSPDSYQTSFLLNSLCEQLNPRHSIYKLSKIIDWESLENDFTSLHSPRGRPAKPVRLMISLLLLKQMHDLSDDQVVEGCIENPYWQLFGGEHELQWSAPVASSDLTHFRKRIGKKGAERLLKLSVDLIHLKIKEEEVVVDTTVQEKNITFPTGAKLAKKVINTCRKIANKEDISLRQSYIRTAPDLLRQASNRKSTRQKKKAVKATRRIRTIGRAILRDLLRKMNDKQLKPHVETLLNATSILFQQKNDKDKIYSLHEPHFKCIAEGKAHKQYEFGTKVSIAKTRDSSVILGALALPGNSYDGHITIDVVLKQLKRITGNQPDILIADRGYRGEKDFGKTQLLTPSRPSPDDTEYKKRKQRNRFRKRDGIEATISHLKQDFRPGRCFLKGEIGDKINITLSSKAYNLRKWIQFRL
jgi:IS5 family transposase